MAEKGREQFLSKTWTVTRTGWVDEVTTEVGPANNRHQKILYNALVRDEDRDPFISRWFNDPVPAADFIDKMVAGYDPRKEKKV